ncbi:MAG: DUF3352 domain-containing protein, partial [Actinomycetota bacterium]|nr:DUF3352 domain-containing protein [Actinomycetota bacterium]
GVATMTTMRGRSLLPVLCAVLALAAAGCGGSDEAAPVAATGTGAAELVVADAIAYGSVDSDLESDAWNRVDALLKKFTFREKLLASVRESLTDEGVNYETDVKPALGPELSFAVLDLPSAGADDKPAFVALHQPKDADRFEALLKKGDDPPAFRAVDDGWYVIGETRAIVDRALVPDDGDSLADSDRFDEGMGELPDDALAKVYVNGEQLSRAAEALFRESLGTTGQGQDAPNPFRALEERFGKTQWLVAGVSATENGLRVEGVGQSEDNKLALAPYAAELPDEVPAGVVAYLSFNDLEQALQEYRRALDDIVPQGYNVEEQLGQFERALGVSLERDVLPLFGGEGALYVQQATPFPAVTLVLEVDDEQKAVATVRKLAAAATGALGTTPRQVEIAGVSATELPLGRFSLFYAGFDGKLVLTSGRDGIEDLRGDGPKLVDDEAFERAREAAEMPDETSGFLYVDLEEGVPLVTSLVLLADQEIPEDVRQNLEPLRSFVAYGTVDGDRSSFAAFLGLE